MMKLNPKIATLSATVSRARARGGVDVPAGLSLNEFARRAGVSPSQLSRIESGKLRKPGRPILVAIARALNRNPTPLLVLAGHFSGSVAQVELRDFFRPGAEAPQEWGEWASLTLEKVDEALSTDAVDQFVLRLIAADLFEIQETVETMWHDAFALLAADGPGADELRRLAPIFRDLTVKDRAQVLAHAAALRDRVDLQWRLEQATDQIAVLKQERS